MTEYAKLSDAELGELAEAGDPRAKAEQERRERARKDARLVLKSRLKKPEPDTQDRPRKWSWGLFFAALGAIATAVAALAAVAGLVLANLDNGDDGPAESSETTQEPE